MLVIASCTGTFDSPTPRWLIPVWKEKGVFSKVEGRGTAVSSPCGSTTSLQHEEWLWCSWLGDDVP